MIITGIKPVGKGRYEIFLDEGSYPAFALYRKELKKFDIREGEDLSDDDSPEQILNSKQNANRSY